MNEIAPPPPAPPQIEELVISLEHRVDEQLRNGGYSPELLDRLTRTELHEERLPAERFAVTDGIFPIPASGVLGGIQRFFKRSTRRLLGWYVHPQLTQQTQFNLALLRDVRALQSQVAQLAPYLGTLQPPTTEQLGTLSSGIAGLLTSTALEHPRILVIGPEQIVNNLRFPAEAVVQLALVRDALIPSRRPSADPLGSTLSFPKKSFDAVIILGVVQRLTAHQLGSYLHGIQALLTPQGMLIVTDETGGPTLGKPAQSTSLSATTPPDVIDMVASSCGLIQDLKHPRGLRSWRSQQ